MEPGKAEDTQLVSLILPTTYFAWSLTSAPVRIFGLAIPLVSHKFPMLGGGTRSRVWRASA
eukprot:5372213-Amphidinium_carterae.1